VQRDGGAPFALAPEKRLYKAQGMPMTEAASDSGLFRDLYVSLGEPLDERTWTLRVYHKPFVGWIWGGTLLMARGFDPRSIFAWPSARTAVMGGAQAAKVMDIVNRGKLERAGQPVNDEALKAMSDGLKRRLDAESTALFGTARLWDDGIVDPAQTRRVLGLSLSAALNAPIPAPRFGVFRM